MGTQKIKKLRSVAGFLLVLHGLGYAYDLYDV